MGETAVVGRSRGRLFLFDEIESRLERADRAPDLLRNSSGAPRISFRGTHVARVTTSGTSAATTAVEEEPSPQKLIFSRFLSILME